MKKIIGLFFLILFSLSLLYISFAGTDNSTNNDIKAREENLINAKKNTSEYIVQFKTSTTEARRNTLLSNFKNCKVGNEKLGIYKVSGKDTLNKTIKESIASNTNDIEYIVPNYSRQISKTPNDPLYSQQWHLPAINAAKAWDITTGTSSVVVAVIDSGIDMDHPDFQGRIVPGRNFLDPQIDPNDIYDINGHGTFVSGVIGAATNNGIGVSGVDWNAKIMPLQAAWSNGVCYDDAIISAIIYAVDHGADVINMSLAGSNNNPAVQSAIDYATSHNVVVVAAAGNDSNSTLNYPAACNGVIGVGSVASNMTKSSFSNYNSSVDVVAPGEDICSTFSTQISGSTGYAIGDGTSFSAPQVSALAALIISSDPSITYSQVAETIFSSSEDLGAAGKDVNYGYGIINASKALQKYIQPVTSISLTTDKASPQLEGTTVTLTALADKTAEYQFCIMRPGSGWEAVTDYSTARTYTWTPMTPGTYGLGVRARTVGRNVIMDMDKTLTFVVTPDMRIKSLSLTANKPSPQLVGTTITLNASADKAAEYQFFIRPSGGSWAAMTSYGTSNVYNWTPTSAGTYELEVKARAPGSSVIMDMERTIQFNVTAPAFRPISWNNIDLSTDKYNYFEGVTWGKNKFVAVGSKNSTGGSIFISSDGQSWSEVSSAGSNSLRAVVSNNDRFIAVGSNGTILTSIDGLLWSSVQSGTNKTIEEVIWNGTMFVAVGGDWNTGGVILTSTNGLSWNIVNVSNCEQLFSIASSGSNFVAVGANGYIITSSDSIHWTKCSSGTTQYISNIIWGDNEFVAIDPYGNLLVSSDGSNWTMKLNYTNNVFYKIIWCGNKFVAIGPTGTVVSSVDGVSWDLNPTASEEKLTDIVWNGTRYVTVGWYNTILSGVIGVGNSVINPTTASFDKKASAQADIAVNINLNGNVLCQIKNGSSVLSNDTDYALSDNTLAIKKNYLAELPTGHTLLTLIFNEGNEAVLDITITNSNSPVSSLSLTTDKASPQPAGTTITLSATADKAAEYQFFVLSPGGNWTAVNSYSTSNTYSWTPTSAGTYGIGVRARAAGTSVIMDMDKTMNFVVTPALSGPVTSLNLTTDKASPQPAGTTITLTATADKTAEYQFFVQNPGGSWTAVNSYSMSNTYSWTPTSAGTYGIGVRARAAGTSVIMDMDKTMNFVVTPALSGPVTSLNLTTDKASPQPAGTTITLTATADKAAEYQFFVLSPGGSWTAVNSFSTNNTYSWTPTSAGTYGLGVRARAVGTSVIMDMDKTMNFVVTPASSGPVTSLNLTTDKASPQPAGTTITLTATADKTAEYQFFVLSPGGDWTAVTGFSTNNTYSWTPTSAGTYGIGVRVRAAGTSVIMDLDKTMNFVVTPTASGPVTNLNLTTDKASSQPAGTIITLTATADKAAEYQFFILTPGGGWMAVTGFSTNNSYTWTPTSAGTYGLGVRARAAGTSVTMDLDKTMNFVVTPAPSGPVASLNLTTDKASSQPAGTTITLTATADKAAEYQFFILTPGGGWMAVTGFSTNNTYTWTPTTAGVYGLGVRARSAGTSVIMDMDRTMNFVVTSL